jgi:hypothetical protein
MASDLGGRGGTRTPDICLVSRVAASARCAATIAIRAPQGDGRTSNRESARLASRSGTSMARGHGGRRR